MDRTMTSPIDDNPYAFAAGGAFGTWDDDYRPASHRLRWLLAAGIVVIAAAACFYLKGGF